MEPKPVVVNPAQCAVDQVRTAQVRYLLTGAQTAGRLAIVEIADVAGSGVPPHVHTREDETFHVVEGELEFTVGDQRFVVGPGAVVYGARGVAHGFRTLTPARINVVITPAGIENLLHEYAGLESAGSDTTAAAVIAARYGVRFVER